MDLRGRRRCRKAQRNMVCRILRTKGAVLTVWGKAQLADLTELAHNLELAVGESGGPVITVSILPAGVPPAEDEVRDHVKGLIPKLIGNCSSVHVVFEGEGFLAAIKRGVLTGLLHATRRQHLFHVHGSQASMLTAIQGETHAAAVASLIQLAQERGYFALNPTGLEASSRIG